MRLLLLALLARVSSDALAQRVHFPPVIVTQPQSQTVLLGSNVTFSVVAQSTDPLFYQWQVNGATLPGATSSNLVLQSVTANAEGDYAVLIKSIGVSKLSDRARLTVVLLAPNDAFTNRSPISGTNVSVQGNNVGASRENGEPIHAAGLAGGRSVWWSWTAPYTGAVTMSTAGSDFSNVLAVYTGDSVSALTRVPSSQLQLQVSGTASQVSFSASQDTTYQIAVDGAGGATGNISLNIIPTAPPNLTVDLPMAGASFGLGLAIEFKVRARDPDGQVVKVEYSDYFGPAIGVATNSPFGFVWTNAPAGFHYVNVVATDNLGASASYFVYFQIIPPPPANDLFAQRIAIIGTNQVTGSNAGATKEGREPDHAGNKGGASIWWTWKAPADGPVTILPSNYTFPFILAVYTGSALSNLVAVASEDAGSTGYGGLFFSAQSNQTYQIAVDGHLYDYQGATPFIGDITLRFLGTVPPEIDITAPKVDEAYSLPSMDAATNVTVAATASDLDGVVQQVEFDLSGPQTYAFQMVTDVPYNYTFTNLPAGDYYLTATATDDVGATRATNSHFRILAPPSGNDNFTNAFVLTGTNVTVTTVISQATLEPGEPKHSQYQSNSNTVWWSWTAPVAGRFAIAVDYSVSYPFVAVYRGDSLRTLTRVGNTDSGPNFLFTAQAGQTFHVVADGLGQPSPSVSLRLFGPIAPPANDNFPDRAHLAGSQVSVQGTTFGATRQGAERDHGGSPALHSVWYEWTPAESAGIQISVVPAPGDYYTYSIVEVYAGTDATTSRLAGTGSGSSPISLAASGGTPYQIVVDSPYGSGGGFTLNLSEVDTPTLITTQPRTQTVLEGRAITFSVVAAGIQPLFYQWQFNGANLPGATKPSLILKNLSADNAGSYTVTITNTFSSVTSTTAVLTVEKDLEPPRLISARSYGNPNQIRLLFSEEVTNPASLSNYALNNQVTVLAAKSDPLDTRAVILTTSPLPRGSPNFVTVTNMTDVVGNPLAADSSARVDTLPVAIVDFGEEVEGFQDDFEAPSRDPLWVPAGFGPDVYVQTDGVLHVRSADGDPNHLLYKAPDYDSSTQEVLARIRVLGVASVDGSRAGVAVAVDPSTTWGINYLFRRPGAFEGGGIHTAFLYDRIAWGPSVAFIWKTNVWYWMRLRQEVNANSGRLDAFAKVWLAEGEATEPANWMITWDYTPSSSAAPSSGFAGITASSFGGPAEFEVDYILIKAAGLPKIKVKPKAVLPRPVFDTFQFLPSGFQLGLSGYPDAAYNIESSTDLSRWALWIAVTNATSLNPLLDPSAAQIERRFYRAVGR